MIYGDLTIIFLSLQFDELDQLDKDFWKNSTACCVVRGSILWRSKPSRHTIINDIMSKQHGTHF